MRTEHHSCTIEEETSKTEKIQTSNANLIISVIETSQRGKELNDAHQRLLTSLGEIADSRGTWIISFSTENEAVEYLEVKQSSSKAYEKPIEYFEKSFGDGILVLDHDDNNSVHSTKHSYLLMRGVESFDCKRKDRDNLGCVVIVVGVDVSVLKKALYAVTHGIPVVFIQGSGSEADLIAACIYQNERSTDNAKEECVHLLKDILEETKYVNIYSQSETTDIKYAILLALKKAHHSTSKLLLSLAWRWNKFDFAQNEIQFPDPMSARDEITSLTHVTNVTLADTLLETLGNDQADFVELLLPTELNVSYEGLEKVYSDVLGGNAVSDPMKLFIQKQLHWTQLNEDTFRSRMPSEFPLLSRFGNLLNAQLNNMCNPYTDQKRPIGFVDLFLFAILFNRQRLGELMWKHCQDKLGTALVASSVLKAFANTAGRCLESELSTDLRNHARDYERKANAILTECYKTDKTKAHDILIKTLEKPFDKIRPLEFANSNYLKEFMGHDCCQTKLNIIWRGNITVDMPWWKVLLALFMPIFIVLIKFTTNNGPCTLCCKKHKQKEESNMKEPELEMTMNGSEQEPSIKEQKQEPKRRKIDFYLKKYQSSKPQLYSVGIFRKNQEGIIHITDAIYYLYTAPLSVFSFNLLSYVIFIIYFSYFIIVDLNEEASFKEYIIWGWVLTMFFEETRECVKNITPDGLWGRIKYWFGSQWNRFDWVLYMCFITTIAMRYTLSGNDFQYVRFVYSVTVGLFSMRFLQAFLVAENWGPKLIMIKKMMFDLLIWAVFFFVFFVSFCVMYQANLYPNSPSSKPFFWDKFWHTPFWQIFGELFLDEIGRGPPTVNCTTDESVWRPQGGTDRCPTDTHMVGFLGGIYMILTNILLNNLLIAMLSHTFANVQEKSGHIWKFYCYGIVREYYSRPVLFPPLIILVHIRRTIRYVVSPCGDTYDVYDSEFRLKDTEGFYSKHLLKFADAAAKRCLKQNKNAKT